MTKPFTLYYYRIVARIAKPKGKRLFIREDDLIVMGDNAQDAIERLGYNLKRNQELREVLWIRAHSVAFSGDGNGEVLYGPECAHLPILTDGFGTIETLAQTKSPYRLVPFTRL